MVLRFLAPCHADIGKDQKDSAPYIIKCHWWLLPIADQPLTHAREYFRASWILEERVAYPGDGYGKAR